MKKPKAKPEYFTEDQVRAMLAVKVDELGGTRAAANRWVMSMQMVRSILNGTRRPTAAALYDLKLERDTEIRYRRQYK